MCSSDLVGCNLIVNRYILKVPFSECSFIIPSEYFLSIIPRRMETLTLLLWVEELNAKSSAELNEELVAAKKELFNLRFQNATNQLDNTSRIKEVRKNIARIQTVLAAKAN